MALDTTPSPPLPLPVDGIDVSRYQLVIDWPTVGRVARGEIAGRIRPAFVYAKATDGLRGLEKSFVSNWIGARSEGLLRGAYHFAQPDEDQGDAVAEADNLCDAIEMAGGLEDDDLPPALDVEKRRAIRAGPPFVEWCLAFCQRVRERLQRTAIIYTGGPFFNEADGVGPIAAELALRIAQHPLWLAAYVTEPDRFVPDAWRLRGWSIWQRSGDVAAPGEEPLRLPGIDTVVDRNVFRGDEDALQRFIADSHVFEIVPALHTMPSPEHTGNTGAVTPLRAGEGEHDPTD